MRNNPIKAIAEPLRGPLVPKGYDPELLYVECGRCGSPVMWEKGKASQILGLAGIDPLELDASCMLVTDGCPMCGGKGHYTVQIFRVGGIRPAAGRSTTATPEHCGRARARRNRPSARGRYAAPRAFSGADDRRTPAAFWVGGEGILRPLSLLGQGPSHKGGSAFAARLRAGRGALPAREHVGPRTRWA
jgi:hypothetical protein